MFRRVYDAEGTAPSRAAVYALARELFRRGQSRATVEHTLRVMRPDMGLSIFNVVLIAWIAHAKGGLPWERTVIGSHRVARR